jgi:2-polyprenyl-6-methoxyphenol hydroxylase-like FAD-dependent oxidoreductase
MKNSDRILIVGGGMAGLTLSIALARKGIVADLVEVKPSWSVYGVGIIVQSNGIRALDRLGLADRCVASGFPYSVSRQCDANGVPFQDRPKPNVSGDRFPSSCGMMRRTLHEILCDEARTLGVTPRLATTVSSLTETSHGVSVSFSDGTQAVYDLVVGADGAYSKIRALVFGEQHRPQYTGQSCWRVALPRPPEVEGAHMYHGTRKWAGLIPVDREQMYLLLLTEEPGNPWMPAESLHVLLRDRLAGFGGRVGAAREMLASPKAVVYSPLEPILMPPPWSKGRVVLIGDAAHAPTPHLAQGASMAFEDAVVLTELLCERDGSIPHTLERFTERRHARCRLIVESSVAIGEIQMRPKPGDDLIALSFRVLEELRAPI